MKSSQKLQVNGLLPVHKPSGMISKDVSRQIQRKFGRVHIGHVGTLDPMASGVLPILIGRTTRLQDFLLTLDKSYEFEVTFGSETDTLDAEGRVVRELPVPELSTECLQKAAAAFVGMIEQVPPVYSAVKFKGRPLYDYARSGSSAEVPVQSLVRKVEVRRFDLITMGGNKAVFNVVCSKGTYIRTLVKDLAEKLGTCGTLTRLVRSSAGGVSLSQCIEMEAVLNHQGPLEDLLLPLKSLPLGIPVWRCDDRGIESRLRNGQQVVVDAGKFVEGLSQQVELKDFAGWARPILLVGGPEDCFGIGSVKRVDTARLSVNMKRGL